MQLAIKELLHPNCSQPVSNIILIESKSLGGRSSIRLSPLIVHRGFSLIEIKFPVFHSKLHSVFFVACSDLIPEFSIILYIT